MVSGVFSINTLPGNDFVELIRKCLEIPNEDRLIEINKLLKAFYKKDPREKVVEIVAGLSSAEFLVGLNIFKFVRDFSIDDNSDFADEVKLYLEKKVI